MSVFIRTDVTAIKLYEEYVLAGIGSSLYIYNNVTANIISIYYQILKGQKIYGIVPTKDKTKLLIFGGKQFKIANRSNLELRLFDFSPGSVVCNDWLHSGIWISDRIIALLTAHNVVQIWDVTHDPVLTSQTISKENSILYSGLLVPLADDVLVFSGTVFSEVIISRCRKEQTLYHLVGHKGVIFSISCSLLRGIIVTTSDDRSIRIWSLDGPANSRESTDYWDCVTISCIHELYGHTARVMRSCITQKYVVSVGEDSGICFWDYDGKLLRRINAHQNAPIWSVDVNDRYLTTGGGDGGVILHPLSAALGYSCSETLKTSEGTAKKIVFTARRNVAILKEEGNLIYYDVAEKSETEYKLKHECTYIMLSISLCKQILAIVDMNGNLDIFIENCKGPATIQNIIRTKLPINKILSMNWAGNRHLVLCSGCGEIYVIASRGNEVEIVSKFTLPHCKERWLTSVAMSVDNMLLVVGDRCGNIHFYVKENTNPIKTFSKVHGRYGPTSIRINTNEIITTGRDGTLKYFSIIDKNGIYYIKQTSSKDVGFQWVEKCIESRDNLICGFHERVFVIADLSNNSKLVEVTCGGGHRSWDVVHCVEKVKDNYEQLIKLIYLKKSDVNLETFQLSKLISRNIIKGTHSKEINCLKSHVQQSEESLIFFISGGEDTTFRVSSVSKGVNFQDEIILKQLSNIRTLKICVLDDEKLLVVSGGGRAQICMKTIDFCKSNEEIKVIVEDLVDFLVKGTDKERKGDKTWRNCSVDFDPETRIMDLEVVRRDDNNFTIYAGCSDAQIRIFQFKYNDELLFKPLGELKYHKTCILKIHCIKFIDKIILLTCSTRGEICFWDITEHSAIKDGDKPFIATSTNKSGINCIASKVISDTQVLIGTGGDDNAIHINIINIHNKELKTAKIVHTWSCDKFHSSQITGLLIVGDILVTASIDHRITVLKLEKCGREVRFLYQISTDVADVQGIDFVNYSE